MSSKPSPVSDANLEELQETVSRLFSHKGVQAVMILNRRGDIVVERGSAADPCHAKMAKQVLQMAQIYLDSLQPDDQVSFLQIRSTKNQEIMIAPHQGYVLLVLKR